MDKNMLINIINRITFTTTLVTKTEKDGTIIQQAESHIKLPQPAPASAPKPVLEEPIGFTFVYEKNPNLKIAAVKPHDDPHVVKIMYKEYDSDGNLLTGQFDRNGNLTSEYSTICFDWHATMQSFSPAFTAATTISAGRQPEIYVVKMLAAAMTAFKKHPNEFKMSIDLYNKQIQEFNSMLKNISLGIGNIQSKLLKQLEEEKEKNEKLEKFLNIIQEMLTENDPEKYSGLIADIRGSLDVPIEERYIKAKHHRRRTRKEAQDAADNK